MIRCHDATAQFNLVHPNWNVSQCVRLEMFMPCVLEEELVQARAGASLPLGSPSVSRICDGRATGTETEKGTTSADEVRTGAAARRECLSNLDCCGRGLVFGAPCQLSICVTDVDMIGVGDDDVAIDESWSAVIAQSSPKCPDPL